MSKDEKVTPISYDCKRLLLEVLTRGYITDEQKNRLSNFFEVETTQVIYMAKVEDFKEIEKMYQEIQDEKERKEALEGVGYIEDTGRKMTLDKV